ncbi:MAG: hypothetical protein ACYDBQ_07595 [Thermoplasmatota archaeon]
MQWALGLAFLALAPVVATQQPGGGPLEFCGRTEPALLVPGAAPVPFTICLRYHCLNPPLTAGTSWVIGFSFSTDLPDLNESGARTRTIDTTPCLTGTSVIPANQTFGLAAPEGAPGESPGTLTVAVSQKQGQVDYPAFSVIANIEVAPLLRVGLSATGLELHVRGEGNEQEWVDLEIRGSRAPWFRGPDLLSLAPRATANVTLCFRGQWRWSEADVIVTATPRSPRSYVTGQSATVAVHVENASVWGRTVPAPGGTSLMMATAGLALLARTLRKSQRKR